MTPPGHKDCAPSPAGLAASGVPEAGGQDAPPGPGDLGGRDSGERVPEAPPEDAMASRESRLAAADATSTYARDAIQTVLIDADQIRSRLAEMGAAISRDYRGLDPVLVAVLRGGAMVMADILRAITIPVVVDFIAVSSYGPETRRTGAVRFLKDMDVSVDGRHVLVVEDIVDTGLTLNYVLRTLRSRRPASLEVGTLLDKPARRLAGIRLKYRGFELPDEFVVGYGLDFDERYRNLPFICVLKPGVYGS